MEYHPKKEKVNAISHGIGWAAAVIASPFLLLTAFELDNSTRILGVLVFCVSLLMVYTSSSLYHMTTGPVKKFRLRILDHVSIYYLIAGTYTPFLVLFLHEKWALWYLIGLWLISLVGTIFKLYFTHRFNVVSTMAYVAMGWVAVFIVRPIMEVMPDKVLWLIAAGGICYSVGVIFYLWKRLFYHHAIWHVFVMGGSFFHFWAVWESLSVEV